MNPVLKLTLGKLLTSKRFLTMLATAVVSFIVLFCHNRLGLEIDEAGRSELLTFVIGLFTLAASWILGESINPIVTESEKQSARFGAPMPLTPPNYYPYPMPPQHSGQTPPAPSNAVVPSPQSASSPTPSAPYTPPEAVINAASFFKP